MLPTRSADSDQIQLMVVEHVLEASVPLDALISDGARESFGVGITDRHQFDLIGVCFDRLEVVRGDATAPQDTHSYSATRDWWMIEHGFLSRNSSVVR